MRTWVRSVEETSIREVKTLHKDKSALQSEVNKNQQTRGCIG